MLDRLDNAHVRVVPAPVFIDQAGVRREVAPSGAIGVCRVRFDPSVPDVVTLQVLRNGFYSIRIERSRVQVRRLDETIHGYHLRAELRLIGLRIVIAPHEERHGRHTWTEPA